MTRILTLVLIATLVSCPMWCVIGACQATERGENSIEASDGSPAPCCCSPSQSSDEELPEPCPTEDDCQGVCGGAVFQKDREVDETSVAPFASLTDENLLLCGGVQVLRGEWVAVRSTQADNYGRTLRVLHASFLC